MKVKEFIPVLSNACTLMTVIHKHCSQYEADC